MDKKMEKIKIDIEKIKALASRGLTKEQIALSLGFSSRTFLRRQQENKEIEQAYREGKAQGVGIIANALFEKAKKGDNTAMIFFLKCNGWKENSETTIKIDTERNVQQLSDAELFEIVENSKNKKTS